MDNRNKKILIRVKKMIEDAMENKIDQDESVPIEIINIIAELHSKLNQLNLTD